jgi:purine-nucleoside phosphorylase
MRAESEQATARIRAIAGDAAIDVGVVLGTGFAAIADQVATPAAISYDQLPGFVRSAGDQVAECVVGVLGTARVAIMRGRASYNETGDIDSMRVPLEVLSLLGAKAVVLIGAAGSMKPELQPGALVAVRDHINLTGLNPLIGEKDAARFVDLNGAYDRHLRERFAMASGELGRKTHEAVYMWFPGPTFETAAEIRAAQMLGADMAGMSIVPETIIARRLGLRVLALAMVTNFAAGLRPEPLTSEQRMRAGAASVASLTRVLAKFFQIWVLESRLAR